MIISRGCQNAPKDAPKDQLITEADANASLTRTILGVKRNVTSRNKTRSRRAEGKRETRALDLRPISDR